MNFIRVYLNKNYRILRATSRSEVLIILMIGFKTTSNDIGRMHEVIAVRKIKRLRTTKEK